MLLISSAIDKFSCFLKRVKTSALGGMQSSAKTNNPPPPSPLPLPQLAQNLPNNFINPDYLLNYKAHYAAH